MESSAVRSDFSKGAISSAILRLAVPMTLAQLVNILYSIVDRIYLGQMQGSGRLALTGVGISLPIISIILGVAGLCGTGGGPLFAIARGKGDDNEAERIMGTSFSLLLIFGTVLTVFVLIFRRQILYMFGASDATYVYACDYLTIYMSGTIFVMIGLGMNPFINAQGFAKTGMLTVIIGAVINIVLDPVLIFTFNMGVRGAALATIVSQFVSFLWVIRFLTGRRTILRLRVSGMKLCARRVFRIIALGTSGLIMQVTTSLVQIICNVTLQKYGGDLFVGVMTVIGSVREVVFMPVTGLNNGSAPVISYNYGADEPFRVRSAIRFSVGVTVCYAAVVWALVMLLPGQLMKMFNGESALIKAGIPAMRTYFMLFVFMSLQTSSQIVFVSLGRTKNAIFFSLLRKAFIAAPLTVLLPVVGLGVHGVFLAEAISQFVGGVACFTTMYFIIYRKLGSKTA